MEDQGKRLLLAVAVAFAIMMLWSVLFPPEKKEEEKKDKPQVTQTAGDGGVAAPGSVPPPGAPAPGTAPPPGTPAPGTAPPPGTATPPGKTAEAPKPTPVTACKEELTVFAFDTFRATFSNCGAGLKSWELMGTKFEDRSINKPMVLGPRDATPDLYGFTITFADTVPAQAQWKLVSKTDTKIVYGYDGADVSVEKAFTLFPDDFLVQVKVSVEQTAGEENKRFLTISQYGYQDPDADTSGGWTRVNTAWKSTCFVSGEARTKSASSLRKKPKIRAGNVKWGGFTHSYFIAAASPKPDKDDELGCNGYALPQREGLMRTDLVYPVVIMKKGDVYGRVLTAYYGPKYISKLDAIDEVVGYTTKFDEAIDLGWFTFIARPLLWLLSWFQTLVVNWGIAIILLTIVVKLATLYWTHKSMRSMKAMAKLAPKVKELQKKYKDDRQRQQVEIMALYKTHKVSPLAGCLPMLLQMPIWFALYRALMAAAELYQSPFIPGWIDDLTATDPFYILPVLLMGTMFLQSKMSPTTPDSTQQKIMMYGLPLMFGVFSFFFPSGLTLYILTNTVLSLLHHLYLHKTDPHAQPAKSAEASSGVSGRKGSKKASASDDADDADDGDDEDDGDEEASAKKQPAKSGGAKNQQGQGQRKRNKRRGGRGRSGKKKKSARS